MKVGEASFLLEGEGGTEAEFFLDPPATPLGGSGEDWYSGFNRFTDRKTNNYSEFP